MIGGPVAMRRAQAGDGRVTLASLAGKFATKGSGSFTSALMRVLRRRSIALQRCTKRCISNRPRLRTALVTRLEIPAELPACRAP
jgi:hypothetical protein